MRALVVFCDPEDARWQWALKPGFRHVFCVLACGDYWVRFDASTGKPVVKVEAASIYDLASLYRSEGWTVVETEQRDKPLRSWFAATNCVGLVKALLNIRAPFAVTPHQLHRHLKEQRP